MLGGAGILRLRDVLRINSFQAKYSTHVYFEAFKTVDFFNTIARNRPLSPKYFDPKPDVDGGKATVPFWEMAKWANRPLADIDEIAFKVWMKVTAFTSLALLTAGCMMGDPRTTEFENESGSTITVSYIDTAFDMGDQFTIETGKRKDLYPNYLFEKLASLKVRDGKQWYSLDAAGAARLATACSEYCTLTYLGRGKLMIGTWEGYRDAG